jgi:hypothetical protein
MIAPMDPMDSKDTVLLAVLAVELGDEIEVLQLLYEDDIVWDELGFRRVPVAVAVQAIQERNEFARREAEEEA